ncbi:hypothetical protein BH11PSE2_BH11PSE2_19650 [soil metagenome]
MATDSTSTPAPAAHSRPRPISATQTRQHLETALDRLLEAVDGILDDLDTIDGDSDLEPSLGSVGAQASFPGPWPAGATDDREEVCEGEGEQVDDEYSLGRTEGLSQLAVQFASDDGEPSLGSGSAINQRHWGALSVGCHYDAEAQCEDEGHDSDSEREGDTASIMSWSGNADVFRHG